MNVFTIFRRLRVLKKQLEWEELLLGSVLIWYEPFWRGFLLLVCKITSVILDSLRHGFKTTIKLSLSYIIHLAKVSAMNNVC